MAQFCCTWFANDNKALRVCVLMWSGMAPAAAVAEGLRLFGGSFPPTELSPVALAAMAPAPATTDRRSVLTVGGDVLLGGGLQVQEYHDASGIPARTLANSACPPPLPTPS